MFCQSDIGLLHSSDDKLKMLWNSLKYCEPTTWHTIEHVPPFCMFNFAERMQIRLKLPPTLQPFHICLKFLSLSNSISILLSIYMLKQFPWTKHINVWYLLNIILAVCKWVKGNYAKHTFSIPASWSRASWVETDSKKRETFMQL